MRLVTIQLHGELQAPANPLSDRRLEGKMKTCLYRNRTNKVVILRCIGPDIFFHEKVVFPWEEWIFSCPSASRVDIWSHGLSGAELLDSFSAEELGYSTGTELEL